VAAPVNPRSRRTGVEAGVSNAVAAARCRVDRPGARRVGLYRRVGRRGLPARGEAL